MTIAIRRPGMIAALLFGAACAASFTSAAHAQDTEPPTFLNFVVCMESPVIFQYNLCAHGKVRKPSAISPREDPVGLRASN